MRTLYARLLAAAVILGAAAVAQQPSPPAEPASPVNARYVDPSPTRRLQPGEKISRLFTRNQTQPYILQRLTERTYWVQAGFYSATFYVGDSGVLLLDPLLDHGDELSAAIREVTSLPVLAIVYSHDHADHIGDAQYFIDAARKAGVKLRIIASKATSEKLAFLVSKHPQPTEFVPWPTGEFLFEDLAVQLHGFERAAHADDASAWLLVEERVVHAPDLVNPDQLPAPRFGGSENFIYYEPNLRTLYGLDWRYLNGGHGNVGAREDLEFYLRFVGDLRGAVAQTLREVKFGEGVDPAQLRSHYALLNAFYAETSKRATEALRPSYGEYYGFDEALPANAEMVAAALSAYR